MLPLWYRIFSTSIVTNKSKNQPIFWLCNVCVCVCVWVCYWKIRIRRDIYRKNVFIHIYDSRNSYIYNMYNTYILYTNSRKSVFFWQNITSKNANQMTRFPPKCVSGYTISLQVHTKQHLLICYYTGILDHKFKLVFSSF